MFVKVIYWDVEKDEKDVIRKKDLKIEHVYDCNHVSLSPCTIRREDAKTDEMDLVLELNKDGPSGTDRTITFPVRNDSQITEIIYMNNCGKTIDRYIY